MLDAESSGIRPTGSNARVRPQPSHLQSFSPVRLFSDTVLKPSPPEGVRGPCRCCDRESAEPPFPSKFQAFFAVSSSKTQTGRPVYGSFREFPLSINALPEKNFVFQKKETFQIGCFCRLRSRCPEALQHTRRQSRTSQKLHHGNLPPVPKPF